MEKWLEEMSAEMMLRKIDGYAKDIELCEKLQHCRDVGKPIKIIGIQKKTERKENE